MLVCIVTWQWGWTVWSSNISRGKRSLSFPKHPFLLWGAGSFLFYGGWGALVQVVKCLLGYEADHSPLSSAIVRDEWCCSSGSPMCLFGMHKDNYRL